MPEQSRQTCQGHYQQERDNSMVSLRLIGHPEVESLHHWKAHNSPDSNPSRESSF